MDKVCGLDVHKDSVFACIIDEKGEKIFEERYGRLTPDLIALRDAPVFASLYVPRQTDRSCRATDGQSSATMQYSFQQLCIRSGKECIHT